MAAQLRNSMEAVILRYVSRLTQRGVAVWTGHQQYHHMCFKLFNLYITLTYDFTQPVLIV